MSLLNWLKPPPEMFWEVYDRWISPAVVEALDTDLHQGLLPKLPRGARVLDLGCGGGQHAVRMAKERPDLQIAGVDISPVMVRRATRLARREGVSDRATFELGDALRTRFPSDSFDAVICAGPVKQVANKTALLAECCRVLAPSGYFLMMEVDRACGFERGDDFVKRTTLPRWAHPILRTYFLSTVAAQSIDLEEARALWAPLPLINADGPRRIDGHPALIAIGQKVAAV